MKNKLDSIKSEIKRRAPNMSSIKSEIQSEIKRRTARKKKPVLQLDEILKSGRIALADLKQFKTSAKARHTYSLRLETSPGKTLDVMLYLPLTKGPHPAILFNFGIGFNIEFAYLARYITKGGWAVLIPAYKGILKGRPLPEDIDNVVTAFRFLRSVDAIKQNKVGIVGASYGAVLAFVGAGDKRIRDDVRYVVSLEGPADVLELIHYARTGSRVGFRIRHVLKKKFLESALEEVRLHRAKRKPGRKDKKPLPGLYKDVFLVSEILKTKDADKIKGLLGELSPYFKRQMGKLSPTRYVSKVTAPVLFVHGSNDRVVPAEQSEKMHKKMLKLGKKSQLIIIEGLGHGILVENPKALVSYLRNEGRATLKRVARFMRR